jgi:nicotinamidase-related amidase
MANSVGIPRALIEGQAAVIVIDIQASTFMDGSAVRAIDNMPSYKERMLQARNAIDSARANRIPVIFIQEMHQPDMVDFGRELDGSEDVHCLEDQPGTEIAKVEMSFVDGDYLIRKRRYSAFFGTDFEILLRGLKVDTLLLCGGGGGLSEVC